MSDSKLMRAGCLWKQVSKKGQTYYSGYLFGEDEERQKLVLFENGFQRDGKKDPDLNLYTIPDDPEKEEDQTVSLF